MLSGSVPTLSLPQSVIHNATFVRGDSTYMITGGTSGLGLLDRTGAGPSRRPPSCSAQSARLGVRSDQPILSDIRRWGAAVHQRACDLADIEQTKAVLAQIRHDLPPLRGIVHGAMVLDDVPVVGLDAARLDRVLRPKTWGAWTLSALTEQDELDFFVLQSSIAAGSGRGGAIQLRGGKSPA